MSDNDKNLAAFPLLDSSMGVLSLRATGMTLRDYFAVRAMQSELMCMDLDFDVIAKMSYEMADAMLKERNK